MNLSNYLQMPPAPQSPAPAGTSGAPAAASLAGVDAAGRFKLDFARIMAQQFQQLPAVKRQDLAALRTSLPADAARTGQRPAAHDEAPEHEASAQDDAAHTNARNGTRNNGTTGNESVASTRASLMARATAAGHTSARASAAPANARASNNPNAASRRDADAANDDPTNDASRPDTPRTSTRRAEDDAALLWAHALTAPSTAVNPLSANTTARTALPAMASVDGMGETSGPTALSLPDGTPLQSLRLGPEVQIVTDPTRAPTPQSLLNFARDMGLDEASLRQLVGEAHGPLTQAPTASSAGSAAGWLATQVIQSLHTTPAATLTPGTGLALGGAEWLQSGWLPAAPPAANPNSGTVTLDVLTLSGGELAQAQITALAESFLGGEDASSSSDNPSPHDGQPAFTAAATAASGNNATATRDVNASNAARPMAEVYQQLSDKLSSEMAARMHQQISAGEWKMKFGLRPAHLGSVEIQLEMKDGKLHADLAADNPLTRELLQNGSQRLRESLANLGIQAERVSVGQGQTMFGQGQAGAQGQGASQRGQLEDNPNPSTLAASTVSEPTRAAPKDPDGLLDLYA